LLGAFEAWVLARCPGYNFSRELTGSYEESEIYALILLKDQNEPLPKGETKRLKFAANLAPDHPEIQRRLALRAIREGHAAKGIARLATLLERHPFFAPGYSLLFSACADSATPVPDSVLNGNALVACSENAELSMQLGAAFGDKGYWVNAIAAYSLANTLAPSSEEASERLAAAITAAKR
jgi:cytochrome c-type biogenesis protein CcmH/NrfG